MSSGEGIKTKVVTTVVSSGILAILGYVAIRIWPSFEKWLIDCCSFLVSILTANMAIPVWLFLPVIIFAAIPLFQILISLRKQSPLEPTWRDYRQGEYFDIIWKWDYRLNGEIINVVAFCPKCSLARTIDPHRIGAYASQTDFICDECGKIGDASGDNIEVWNKVIRKIDRDITTDEWKKK